MFGLFSIRKTQDWKSWYSSEGHGASKWRTGIRCQVRLFSLYLTSLNLQGGDGGGWPSPPRPVLCATLISFPTTALALPCHPKAVLCNILRGPVLGHSIPARGVPYQISLAAPLLYWGFSALTGCLCPFYSKCDVCTSSSSSSSSTTWLKNAQSQGLPQTYWTCILKSSQGDSWAQSLRSTGLAHLVWEGL